MTDVRLIGRPGVSGLVESLGQDARRMVLCTRDFARDSFGGEVQSLIVTPSNAQEYAAFPKEHINDGNRNSYCQVSDFAEQVEIVLRMGTERKTLLQLESLQDEDLELTDCSMSNDGTSWTSVFADMTELYRGARSVLYSLPYDKSDGSRKAGVNAPASGVSVEITGTAEADDYWNGFNLVAVTGENADQVREIRDWDQGTKTATIASPFPHALAAGDEVLLKKFSKSWLFAPFLKAEVGRRYETGQPLRIAGLSVFDFAGVLKGEADGFREQIAPNPTGARKKGGEFSVTETINGAPIVEEPGGGLKESLSLEWPAATGRFYDLLRDWQYGGGSGFAGLIDMDGYFRSVRVSAPTAERRPTASNISWEEDRASVEVVQV